MKKFSQIKVNESIDDSNSLVDFIVKNVPDLAKCNQCETVNVRRTECVKCGNWVGESSRAASKREIIEHLTQNPD